MKPASTLVVIVAFTTACSRGTKMKAVEIVGLPCAKGELVTPILIQADHGNGTLKMQYMGGSSWPPAMSLPEGTSTTLNMKFAFCRYGNGTIDCTQPQWVGGVQTISVDTRDPDARVVLGAPGEHPCK